MSDHHKFHTHLPRGKKEFALFMLIVSVISVCVIAPLVTFSEIGISGEAYLGALKILPFIWLCIIPLVLLTEKPAMFLAGKIVKKGDSFSVTVLINVLCNVFLISIFMTIIGSWIGQGDISWEPIRHFFLKWSRNFAIAFTVESLIAQPIARLVMSKVHIKKDKRVV
ncbi:MAG: hypothetical protein LBM97_01405 [Candidatus Nomurabacteria bacterium]|jgi:hypothetical protein|nr:hypothetical protein [Candidatus Nomurabacteria bacterium]